MWDEQEGWGGEIGLLQWAKEGDWWYMGGTGCWCVEGRREEGGPLWDGEEGTQWGGDESGLGLLCGWWGRDGGWMWGARSCPVGCPMVASVPPRVMRCLLWSWEAPDCCAANWSWTNIMWSPTRSARVRGERPDRKSLTCTQKEKSFK